MLLQNPQLSYALLQAQVVMKIVNPEIAQVWFAEISIVNLRPRNCYICKQNSAQKIHCSPKNHCFVGNIISSGRPTTALAT